MIVISIIITNMLPTFVCLGLSLVWVRVPIIGSEHCLSLWVTDSCCCCLTDVTEEDCNSMTVSGLTRVSSIEAMMAEVRSRFWSWNLVEIFRMNFSRDLKADQLLRWLKSNYFGERTQTLSLWQSWFDQPKIFINVLVRNVPMYICFAVIYAKHKIAIKSRNAIYLNPESIKQYI